MILCAVANLYITAQSGPILLVILRHYSYCFSQGGISDTDYENL